MNTTTPTRAALERIIHAAFVGVTLGAGVSLGQAQVIDNYGEGVTDEEFAELPKSEVTDCWEKVSWEALESDNVAHLDPEGFRYYIPAFMLSVLERYESASMRVIGTLSALYPERYIAEYHMPRYDLLTYEQKQAIACFVEALPALVELDGEDVTLVEQALKYWRQFLPIARLEPNANDI